MFKWIYKLQKQIENELDEHFFDHPAKEEQISELENKLQIKLPESFKSFLLICNGTLLSSTEIFSTDKILEFTDEWGFWPWNGKIEYDYDEENVKDYYSDKPMHFLVFARMDALNYCFDTRELINGEYPVCVYEPENEEVQNLKVYSSSFDKFLKQEIVQLSDWWELPDEWFEAKSFEEKIACL